jgi:hypothetical protein
MTFRPYGTDIPETDRQIDTNGAQVQSTVRGRQEVDQAEDQTKGQT